MGLQEKDIYDIAHRIAIIESSNEETLKDLREDSRAQFDADLRAKGIEIEIDRENSLNSVDGHKVIVELIKKINNNRYKGKVTKKDLENMIKE